MTAKKTGRKSQKTASNRLSRTTLDKSVADLTQRLRRQYELAQAISACAAPHEDQTMMEFNVRTVFRARMETLVQGLDDAYDFAQIIKKAGAGPATARPTL
jgi:hypothetical protein